MLMGTVKLPLRKLIEPIGLRAQLKSEHKSTVLYIQNSKCLNFELISKRFCMTMFASIVTLMSPYGILVYCVGHVRRE